MMDKNLSEKRKRNPADYISLSLRFTKDYLKTLCEIREKHTETEIQESEELKIVHRALWTALIIEVGKLFDTSGRYESCSLKKTDFFKEEPYKSKIDRIYNDPTISKIRKMGNTFTRHLSEEKEDVYAVAEICNSKLEKLLDELDEPIKAFEKYSRIISSSTETGQ